MDDDAFAFPPPAFKPDEALLQLQRSLRGLKLSERGAGFELRGRRVAELQMNSGVLHARMARKLALTPEWDRSTLADTNAQRKWLAELNKRLARWQSED